jgi:Xaa-Pro aminopeptidase
VSLEPADGLLDALDGLGRSGAKVLVDPDEVHLGFVERLRAAGAKVVEGESPVVLAKACKNATEIQGAVDAQRRDGAAVARFLAWLDARAPRGPRRDRRGWAAAGGAGEGPAVPRRELRAISAHGPNSALPHYRSTPASNRPLTPARST